ncbi:MarR family transcriptional regulator [Rhodococcus rhodnii]|uniref:MarR family transcriptional regulator n=2 Tax=Rhodococcus rhodnii TaxID=38312 RepID=R7WTH2_9NOCA|nr:MarR family transcriptional regulator [Rhodococcus rhodnii]EOM78570.1 MarR family transcriptional regulator [Rhodococcus rhodnii LMG 5362]TXG91355.1 MarR family transcriptional regulator [Rhodococcus rhodnii]
MDDVQWLDDEEREAWLALIALITRLPSALDTQLQRDSGMTHFEYSVMAQLSMADGGRLQLAVLARRSNASLSRLSHVVTKLERLGWVVRDAIPESRASDAVLTEAGREKMADAAPGHVAAVRSLVFDGLSPAQTRQLAKVSRLVTTQLDIGIAADAADGARNRTSIT